LIDDFRHEIAGAQSENAALKAANGQQAKERGEMVCEIRRLNETIANLRTGKRKSEDKQKMILESN
jgi:hypothetical protein